MKEKLLEFLACPICGGDLFIAHESKRENAEILEGVLNCRKSLHEYKIERGVPRFVDFSKIEPEKAVTAENFGWQWQHFKQSDKNYAAQFLGWIYPVKPEFFKGKVILDAGCGKGRHLKLAAEWGAEEVVGIDFSSAVETAFEVAAKSDKIHIIQADIFRLPLKKVFDYAYCVGVLHHTTAPAEALRLLAAKILKGGAISVWVYGAENNEWISKYVDPIREGFTSKINHPTLYQISKLPTLGVFLASKFFYKPADKTPLGKKLFYHEYLSKLGSFSWREQHSIVFDHLSAPLARYVSRSEFEKWWKKIPVQNLQINWHNQNSWSGFANLTS